MLLLNTHDLSKAEEVLGQTYAAVRLGSSSSATHLRLSRNYLASLSIDDAEFSADLSYDTDSPERICLCRVRSGVIEEHLPAQEQSRVGADQLIALGALDVPFTGGVEHAHFDVLMVDRNIFDRVAAVGNRRNPEPVRLTDSRPMSNAASRHLVHAIDYFRDRVLAESVASDGLSSAGLIASTATQYLAASMLAAFPNNALIDPSIEDRHDTTPLLLRRAIAFIEEHADSDVSIADIAAAVGVTPRAVQLMFRRHRDCTPMEYLRRVRLHHAHRELLHADRNQTTVAAIASRWGFAHSGRFAVYYFQVFRQSPHATLRG
jgi:AraC-like DNA-binding protein